MIRQALVIAVSAAALAHPWPVEAQSPGPRPSPEERLRVTAPPAESPPPGIRFDPTMPIEAQTIREQEFYPGPVRSRHEPAFVIPFVTTVATSATSSMRVGFSGWTAPAIPFDIPQSGGGVAFGLTITWGGPPVEPSEAPPETR